MKVIVHGAMEDSSEVPVDLHPVRGGHRRSISMSVWNDQALASHAFKTKHRHLLVQARTSLLYSCRGSHLPVVQLTNPTCHPSLPSGPSLSQGHHTHLQTERAESERVPVDLAPALATMQLRKEVATIRMLLDPNNHLHLRSLAGFWATLPFPPS